MEVLTITDKIRINEKIKGKEFRIISSSVEPQREIMGISSLVLTNYAPPVTYNELTYQSEGMTGHRGLFLCMEKYT